jgi:hypothetical protein
MKKLVILFMVLMVSCGTEERKQIRGGNSTSEVNVEIKPSFMEPSIIVQGRKDEKIDKAAKAAASLMVSGIEDSRVLATMKINRLYTIKAKRADDNDIIYSLYRDNVYIHRYVKHSAVKKYDNPNQEIIDRLLSSVIENKDTKPFEFNKD